MSYDLYFKSQGQDSKPDSGAFAEYFKKRRNYKVSDKQAFYQNETTGVYFGYDLNTEADEKESDMLPVRFNLNYFRPHIFGLEAEPEVASFVKEFELLVFDPQIGGMGDGEYSTNGFLNGWNKGNEFAYESVLKRNPQSPIHSLPTLRIDECWRWNAARDGLQKEFGENVFVPRYMFVQRGDVIVTTVVWPDGIPIAMPDSDTILVQRKSILPKRFFRSVEDMAFTARRAMDEVLGSFPIKQGALPYHLLDYTSAPESVVVRLRQLEPTKEKLEAISVDQILNAEMVNKARVA
jgi:hypothetical protein